MKWTEQTDVSTEGLRGEKSSRGSRAYARRFLLVDRMGADIGSTVSTIEFAVRTSEISFIRRRLEIDGASDVKFWPLRQLLTEKEC